MTYAEIEPVTFIFERSIIALATGMRWFKLVSDDDRWCNGADASDI
jgi:hypothetical protein